MDARRSLGLVGRADALARVERALDAARGGTGATLLISGAAGMGKTALLREGLSVVLGMDLSWGTGIEAGGAPGYWPWTQALNGLVRSAGLERALAAAGTDRGLLATLVSALGEPGVVDESDRTRMLLLDATVAWLHALGRDRPVAIVLDDLQWIDESSLGLLELVIGDPRPASICLLGAYRHDEMPRHLQARFAALVARADHVHLAGLDRAAAGELVQLVAPRGVPEETVEAIFRRAGGHPFFTRELAFAAVDSSDDEIPAAVRDAVRRRVQALSKPVQEMLRAAALIGLWLSRDVLAAVTGQRLEAVDEAAAEAVAAGILVAGEGGFSFAHDLFRETIADGIERASKPMIHLAVGHALEARADRGAEAAASEIARHFRAAITCGALDHAVRWALQAAAADKSALALSEAATHLRRLRGAVADAGAELGEDDLVKVLLAEADVLARMGRLPDAQGLIRAARAAAGRASDPKGAAQAALAGAALGSRFATRRDDVIHDLESTLAALGDSNRALEARLTAELARALQHSVPEQRARAEPLSDHALELGRGTGDPDVFAACLLARHDVLWSPGYARERAQIAEELVLVAHQSGDRERLAEALLLQANALLESGSAAFQAALEECFDLLRDLGQPLDIYTLETRRACLALLRGDLTEAERRIDIASEMGERLREPDAGNVWMSQRLELVRARALPGELAEFARAAVEHWTGAPVHAHCVAAGFLARAGDLEEARRHVAAVDDLGTWRADRSYLRSVFMRELAVAATALEDRDLCTELFAELEPLAGSCGVNGAMVAFAGCHSHTAGLLAAALGDATRARELLQEAIAVYRRVGAAFEDARDELDALGTGGAWTASMRRRGRVWEVAFGGRTASVVHSKGLKDIAELVLRPDQDVHVLDLMSTAIPVQGTAEIADRRAIESYRKRIAELSEEREEAERSGDTTRLLAVEEEHQSLLVELKSGTGLGGRTRHFANHPTERARKAVTARIRDAIRRLEDVMPELGAHLDQYLATGVQCRYRGAERWHVEF